MRGARLILGLLHYLSIVLPTLSLSQEYGCVPKFCFVLCFQFLRTGQALATCNMSPKLGHKRTHSSYERYNI